MKSKQLIAIIAFFLSVHFIWAQNGPTFNDGQDPLPKKKSWKLIANMSDEFDGSTLDNSKWQSSGQRWIGRAPGLFLPENVNVADGSLKVTTTMLPEPVTRDEKEFTHGGGYVSSRNAMTYGFYECEMKANKTFMSSTFWLINDRHNAEGCDQRTTELDIQESVGEITNDAAWMTYFDEAMNSNTHSRDIPEGCDFEKDSRKAGAHTGGKVFDDFHVYGVWWKSKDEIWFYLDGDLVNKVTPPSDFNLPMYLRMVVETYNWNPVPEGGGMNKSVEDRTTTYNWVRSWEVVDSE